MTKRIGLVSLGTLLWCVALLLVLSLPATLAWAQATQPPGGGPFSIPTSTPAGGALSGGLVIPTSTPVGGVVSSTELLPRLGDAQLQSLGIQDSDVQAPIQAGQVETFTIEEVAAQLEAAGAQELADQLRALSEQYGWTRSVAISHPACEQTMPVTRVFSEVAQLGSAELARMFVDDPRLHQFYSAIGITVSPVTSVHGFYTISQAQTGECFASETEYSLNFEYWGLLISVGLKVNSSTDPAMVNGLLDQLAGMVVARVDALAGGSPPSTPAAPAVSAPVVGAPTVSAPIAGVPTVQPLSALIPTQSGAPVARPTATPVQTTSTTQITLADVEAVMPTIRDIGLPNIFALNSALSQTQTREQTIAFWQQSLGGTTPLTNSLAAALQQSQMIGQVVRVWDTGNACPDVVGLSVELDVLLFQDANGPISFVNNQDYREALEAVGIQFEEIQGGGWYSVLAYTGDCGDMITYTRSSPAGQYLISSSVIAYETSNPDDVIEALDTLTEYMADRLQ